MGEYDYVDPDEEEEDDEDEDELEPLEGPGMPLPVFKALYDLEDRHIARLEALDLLRTYSSAAGEALRLDEALEFERVRSAGAASEGGWPPPLPMLEPLMEERFASQPEERVIIADEQLAPFVEGLSLDRVLDEIADQCRPSLRLLPQDQPMGSRSRLGGLPELAEEVAWPAAAGMPLAFVGQVDLDEVRRCLPDSGLPARGLLSFFYDPLQRAWGLRADEGDHWAVMFSDGPTYPVDFPEELPPFARFPHRSLVLRPEMTLPPSDSPLLDLTSREAALYASVVDDIEQSRDSQLIIHRLLGHPDPVTEDPLEAARSLGPNVESDPWKLLLQVDSDPPMSWGSEGRLYFMIRESSLRQRDWESVRVTLQATT